MSFLLWEVFLSRCLKSYGFSFAWLLAESVLETERLSAQHKTCL